MQSQAEVFKEKGSSWQGNTRGLAEPLCLISTQVSKTRCAMLNTNVRNPFLCLPEQCCTHSEVHGSPVIPSSMWNQQVLCSSEAVQCKASLPGMVMVFPVSLLAWPVLPRAGLNALGARGIHVQPLTRVCEASWSHSAEYVPHHSAGSAGTFSFFPGYS